MGEMATNLCETLHIHHLGGGLTPLLVACLHSFSIALNEEEMMNLCTSNLIVSEMMRIRPNNDPEIQAKNEFCYCPQLSVQPVY